jgi:TRAP-type mannitol/chloroaromatic compound transport system substrate-binding protein
VQSIVRPWLDEIEELSGGRMEFEVFSAGELVPGDQTYTACAAGTIPIVHTIGNWGVPTNLVDLETYTPFAWTNPLEILTMWEHWGMKELFNEEYDALGGIRHMGPPIITDPIHLVTTSPIWDNDDFDGLKILADGVISPPLVAMGATAMSLPVEEFYLAGQSGIVDGLIWAGSTETSANSWHEVYPYFLNNPPISGNAYTHFIINRDFFDSLPPDLQALMDASLKIKNYNTILFYYENEPKTRGLFELTELPEEDIQELKEFSWARWDTEIAPKNPQVAKLVQIFKDYNAHVEDKNWYR